MNQGIGITLSQTDERWEIVDGKRQSLIKDKFIDRVVGETIKPCPETMRFCTI